MAIHRKLSVKHILAIMFVALISSISTSAQEAGNTVKKSIAPGNDKSATAKEIRPDTFLLTPPSFSVLDQKPASIYYFQSTGPLPVTKSKFIVRDGAVYLSIFENSMKVPLIGGGASDCFSLYLPERIENLKRYIETLTPIPQRKQGNSK